MTQPDKINPVFMPEDAPPIDLNFHDVIAILRMIEGHGKLEALAKLAEQDKLSLTAPPETVNAVKTFIAADAELSADPVGHKVLVPPPTTRMAPRRGDRQCCGFSPAG